MAFILDVTNIITANEKIYRRSGHVAVMYKNWMIVWGGYVDHEQETPISQITSSYHNTDELWIYDCSNELWDRTLTKGDIPPRNSGSCGVLHGDMLYIFGGFHGLSDPGAMDGNSNQLYRLDLRTLTWEWLHPTGNQPTPCDKLAGWEYMGKMYFFGGFGPQPEYGAPFEYVIDNSTEPSGWARGWNNQLVVYNPKTNEWEWPKIRGPAPSPRAAHAADITGSKVFVFGGRLGNTRNNELHCLDLDKLSWSGKVNNAVFVTDYNHILLIAVNALHTPINNIDDIRDVHAPQDLRVQFQSHLSLTRPFELNPEGRSWHSFTFIRDTCAVVYGGLNQFNTVLNDCWLLDIHSDGLDLEWMEFTLPYDHGEPRCAHTACVFDGELLIHSGSTQPFYETRLKLKVNTNMCVHEAV
ncbi:Kelch domain-containing protein 2 [Blattella germanica]|nr:Kelch domain-containing protein 2 [Blattella germanica]